MLTRKAGERVAIIDTVRLGDDDFGLETGHGLCDGDSLGVFRQ